MLSSNLARHQKSSCGLNQQGGPIEIVIEPELVTTLSSAGIELSEVADIQEHPIEISLQLISKADGSTGMVFNRILVNNFLLDVKFAPEDK